MGILPADLLDVGCSMVVVSQANPTLD